MLRLRWTPIPEWPPLAWLARCRHVDETIDVFHGSQVEVADEWFVEAVWAGDYSAGDFDRTDLVFGTGGRIRGGALTFVSAGCTLDRLQFLRTARAMWVSNSLVCLLAATNAELDPTFDGYFDLFRSIIHGIRDYQPELPTSAGPVRLTYYHNLTWDGHEVRQIEKPDCRRDFATYEKYRSFLDTSLRQLSQNLSAAERRLPYRWLGTMSSGYDSLTTAVLAMPGGLNEVISVTEARGGERDSGEQVAGMLGVTLHPIERDAWRQIAMSEVPFIAADAKGEDVLMRGAEPLLGRRVLVTGHNGDHMWGRYSKIHSDLLERTDTSGLSLTEFRLWTGFLVCPIAFLGARQLREVTAIGQTPEMRPWDVGGRYSRPVARRIIEEAGVRRGCFAARKRAASVLLFHRDSFLSATSLQDFLEWLTSHRDAWLERGRVPPAPQPGRRTPIQSGLEAAARAVGLLDRATGRRFWQVDAVRRRLVVKAAREPLFRYVFPWAVARAKQRYGEGLRRLPAH